MPYMLALFLTFLIGAAPSMMHSMPQDFLQAQPVPEVITGRSMGATVDGAAWRDRFEALWDDGHDVPFQFIEQDALTDWTDAYNLAYGLLEDAVTMEIYQIFDAPEEYWIEANLYQEDVPVLSMGDFEAYFYEAIEAGILACNEQATVGELKGLVGGIRDELAVLTQEGAEETNSGFYYDDFTYVSLHYDTDSSILRCRICFPTE